MRFSVIIPAYNEEHYLPRLLNSIEVARGNFSGGRDEIEVIVADNDSTDATAETAAAQGARVVLCGRISQTHAAEPYGVRNLGRLAAAHGRMQGFLVFNYHDRYDEARTWLAARRRDGSLRQRLHVLEGLAQAPIGLGMLFRGENTGKLVVRVAAG